MISRRVVFAALAAYVAYLAIKFNQIPVPDGFEEPSGYKMVYSFIAFSGVLFKPLKYLDIATEVKIMRGLGSYSRPPSNLENIEVFEKQADGVRVKVYRVPKRDKSAINVPGFIFYHGGGFSTGEIEGYENLYTSLIHKLGITVVSVDYRLTPFNPFPTPSEDCYTATKYVFDNSDEFLIDPDRIILAGDSAGGTIAAAVSQRLLKEGRKQPKLQVLIYPWMQMFDMQLPSSQIYSKKGIFSSIDNSFSRMAQWYIGTLQKGIDHLIENNQLYSLLPTDRVKQIREYLDVKLISSEFISDDEKEYYKNYNPGYDQYSTDELKALLDSVNKNQTLKQELLKAFTPEVSPVIAEPERIKGLPKAYFAIPEWDTLKDEGLIYAERLKRAGVDVTVQYYKGAFHGILSFQDFTKAKNIISDVVTFVEKNI